MAMAINVKWFPPVLLRNSRRDDRIYEPADENLELPAVPGVYLFARRHGENMDPVYIGQAKNINVRFGQHLKSVPLMLKMSNTNLIGTGSRYFVYATVAGNSEDLLKRKIDVLERALIQHALSQGFTLLQVQNTRKPTHSIRFEGNTATKGLFPRKMLIRAT